MPDSQNAGDFARWQGGVDVTLIAVRDGQTQLVAAVESLRTEGRERNHQMRDSLQTIGLANAEMRRDVSDLREDHKKLSESVSAKHKDLDETIESLERQVAPWTWGKRVTASLVGGMVLALTFAEKIGTALKALRG